MTSYLTSHCMNPRQRSAPLEGRQSGGYSPTARLRFPTGEEQNLGEGPFPSPRRLRRGGRRTLDIRASIMLGWFHYIKVFPIVNRVCRFFSPSLEFFCSSLQNSRRGGMGPFGRREAALRPAQIVVRRQSCRKNDRSPFGRRAHPLAAFAIGYGRKRGRR